MLDIEDIDAIAATVNAEPPAHSSGEHDEWVSAMCGCVPALVEEVRRLRAVINDERRWALVRGDENKAAYWESRL